MSHIASILTQARALYASSPSHCPVDDLPEDGTYCPITAITLAWRALRVPGVPSLNDARIEFRLATGSPSSIARWNAESTTEEVLAAFDRAIENLA